MENFITDLYLFLCTCLMLIHVIHTIYFFLNLKVFYWFNKIFTDLKKKGMNVCGHIVCVLLIENFDKAY